MKILNISLDKKISDKNSAVSKRIVEYEKIVDKYTVITLDNKKGKLANFFKIFKQAKKVLKNEKYDVITVQDVYFVGFLALILAKKFKIGLEVQVHGFEKFKGLRKILAKRVLKKADAVRVVSQRLRKKLIKDFKIKANKITVMPIFVNTNTHELNTNTHKLKNDKFIFLTVGRLVPVKNIEMQIESMKNVISQYSNTELWIAGDGTERKNLELTTYNLQLDKNIKFLGWQNDLEKYYSQSDVFLLTSNSEGWGMAAVEAGIYSLPIIMTDVGLAGEVIKNNESGIVIPVGDQEALETAMIRIIENENLRKKLGKGACEAVKKLPSQKETLELYKQSWQKAIDNNKK